MVFDDAVTPRRRPRRAVGTATRPRRTEADGAASMVSLDAARGRESEQPDLEATRLGESDEGASVARDDVAVEWLDARVAVVGDDGGALSSDALAVRADGDGCSARSVPLRVDGCGMRELEGAEADVPSFVVPKQVAAHAGVNSRSASASRSSSGSYSTQPRRIMPTARFSGDHMREGRLHDCRGPDVHAAARRGER